MGEQVAAGSKFDYQIWSKNMYLENFIQKEIIIINLYKPLIINKTSIAKIA